MLGSPLLAEAAPAWQSILAIGGFVGIIGGVVSVQLWAQRRRRRGEEASTYNAEGAEAIAAVQWTYHK